MIFMKMGAALARLRRTGALLLALGLLAPMGAAHAFGFDRFDEREDSGIWSRSNQKALDVVAAGTVLGLALFEGTDTRIGKTAWQAVDATLMTAVTTEVMKRAFGRPRPADNPDPNTWFAGSKHRSFPSGETAMIASLATPFIMQYHEQYPAVWALAALPLYMGKARMTSQAHWLTDVLAGGAIGAAYGVYASRRDVPLVLGIAGKTAFVGLHYRF